MKMLEVFSYEPRMRFSCQNTSDVFLVYAGVRKRPG